MRSHANPDTASAPLIARDSSEDSVAGRSLEETLLTRPNRFTWLLTLAAGVSGLLFGFDTGIISSTLVSISTSLSGRELTTMDKSLITSSTSLFALIASPLTGLLADAFGRRRVILLASLLFAAGALLQAFSSTVAGMIAGRSIVGLAVGSASFVAPLYISELSPAPFRGRLVVVSSLLITGGQVVAYVVGWLFSTRPDGWRWMVGLGAVPALVQLLMLLAMPETPRWLVKAGRTDEALDILRKVYAGVDEDMVERLVAEVSRKVYAEVDAERTAKNGAGMASGLEDEIDGVAISPDERRCGATFAELFGAGPSRRALAVACLLQASQQLCGFNSLMYFSATIFYLVGFSSPTLTSMSVAITNFIFTVVAFYAIDRIGRRKILLLSLPFMVAAMAVAAVAFLFLHLNPRPSTMLEVAETRNAEPWPAVLLAGTVIYVAAYALGLGTVPWQQSELFTLSVRSVGSGLATATNWGSNFIVGLTFLPMMDILTPSGAFAVFGIICALSWIAIYAIYPETAGLGLEEVGVLLRHGFGVRQSVAQWESRRQKSTSNL